MIFNLQLLSCVLLRCLAKKTNNLTKKLFMKRKLLLLLWGAFLLFSSAFAQQKIITGKIISADDGQTIPGASVRIKGGAKATQTNNEGSYSIQAQVGDVLVFSFIGLVSQERAVSTASVINVTLNSDAKALNEIEVTTAYGINRNPASLGYSTPNVSGDEVANTQRESFFNGLQGRVPGLSVNPTSGDPGASAQIVLRGFVSISGDNSPLMVIDGLPMDNSILNQNDLVSNGANRDADYSNRAVDINPADIESYTILKGPEATALYGNLGASGAIIITTKKAKAGKGSISYNNSFRVEEQINFPEIQLKYNQGLNGNYDPTTTSYLGPAYIEGQPVYDNLQEFFETGIAQKHNLAFEGGSDKYTYRWSNEYTDNKGTIPTSQFTRFSTRLTGTAQINPILNLTTTLNYIDTYNKKVSKGVSGYLMSLLRFPSRYDINDWQDELGNRLLHVGSIYSEFDNPLWEVNKNLKDDRTNRILANSNLTLKPTKWLTINGTLGADISTTSGLSVYHAQSYLGSGSAGTPTGGSVLAYDKITKILNGSLTASAKHKFGKFNNTFVMGATFADNNYTTNSQSGQNMYDPDFYSINNTLLTTQRNRTSVNRYRNVGVFGQAILGYESIFFLTLSGRVDGASRLMPNTPYFAYPAASFAFNFTEFNFIKENLSFISSGKIRASAAFTGKEPWRQYATKSNLENANSTGGGFAYNLTGGNADLKAETSKNIETGFELQFFNNRLGIDFTVYQLRSSDQIILPRTSYGTGFALRMMNGGEVQNRGTEIQLTGNPIKAKGFNWDITFNYSQNEGKVLSIAAELPELYDSDTWVLSGVRSTVFPGGSTGTIGGYTFDRNINGDVLINPATGLPLRSTEKYSIIGDRTPEFTLGMVNNFRYKGLNLSFLWDLRVGGDVLNGTEYRNYLQGLSTKTLDREEPRVITGVLKDGLENTDNPTPNVIAVTPFSNSNYYTANVAAEMFVEKDIKTLRLRDITLGYDFPKSFMKKIKFLQNLGAFVTLTDVVLFTNYSGMDPESNQNTPGLGGIGGYGFDLGNMGRPFGMNFGLRVKL
jgi:ferric enterobactin receptor